MKFLTITSILLASIATTASAQANVVESHLSNIQDRIRACTVLPYTKKDNHRVFHHLISHCPEVQLVALGKGKVKIGGTTFQAALIETEYTDGDVYDIVIRDATSHDEFRMRNVLAFGDVLLGMLGGNTKGIMQTYMPSLK